MKMVSITFFNLIIRSAVTNDGLSYAGYGWEARRFRKAFTLEQGECHGKNCFASRKLLIITDLKVSPVI